MRAKSKNDRCELYECLYTRSCAHARARTARKFKAYLCNPEIWREKLKNVYADCIIAFQCDRRKIVRCCKCR